MGRVASSRASATLFAASLIAVTLLAAATLPGVVRGTSLGWTVSGPRIKVLGQGPAGSLDSARVFQPAVVRNANGSYFLYYTGSDGAQNRILSAFSRDGFAWTKLNASLTLNSGASSPFVMLTGTGYRMWFESIVPSGGPLGYTDRIYGAASSDGVHWTVTGMVLDVGNAFEWDNASVGDPMVVQTGTQAYRMYYSMYAANRTAAVGIALSTDGTSFTKWSGNPVLIPGRPGAWDDSAAYAPSVVQGTNGANWTLFYWGYRVNQGGRIGIANSSDGYHWVRVAQPLLGYDGSSSWDSGGVGWPEFVASSPPRLYFAGGNGAGEEGIGVVNLTAPSGSGGTPGGGGGTPSGSQPYAVFGLPPWLFALLVTLAGAGVAVVVPWLGQMAGRPRQRP